MIVVDIPGKSIEVVLAGAVATTQLPFVVNYTNVSREGRKSIGSTDGTTNSTTAVTILAAASSGARREVESISLYNADSGSVTATIRINNNSTTRIVVKVVLATLDHLIYTAAAGWFVMTSAGFIKSTLTATNLDDLGDVAITSPTTSSILIYDGTNFIDSTATYLNTMTANRVFYASATNVMGTAAGLTFDGTTLTAHTLMVSTGALTVSLATDSTSISTGAAIVAGGVGITKALWVGGLANIAGAVTLQSTLALANTLTLTNASTAEIKVVRGSVSLGILQSSTRTQVGTTTNDSWALAVNSADSLVVLSTGITIPGTLGVTGIITATAGTYIGAAAAANQIDDASNGAGSTTLYIGNATITVSSDERLKRNIKPLEDGLSIVKALLPVEYDQDEERPFGDVEHYVGFGARHTHKIAPWSVHTQGDTGLPWKMRQEFLMAPVVRALQQLVEKVAALEERNALRPL